MRTIVLWLVFISAVLAIFSRLQPACADEPSHDVPSNERYHQVIKPLLQQYCYDCHGDGAAEGNRAFDELEHRGELLTNKALWSLVMKNVRSGIMPPMGSSRPSNKEVLELVSWIKQEVYGIDTQHPDPGPRVLRRLNRTEYQRTIRDLLGFEFNILLHFPPDDTGYGFDTVGDVLTVSPMLTEKYLRAAENIVDAVVPKVPRQPAKTVLQGSDFIDALTANKPEPETPDRANRSWPRTGEEIHFDEAADLSATFAAPRAGHYVIDVELRVDGQFEYNALRSKARFFLDQEELIDRTFAYHDGESYFYRFERDWEPGEHSLQLKVSPLPALEGSPPSRDSAYIRFKIIEVSVTGPTEEELWVKPVNYERIFPRDLPPQSDSERFEYAREVLQRFAMRAFRRPIDSSIVASLTEIAAAEYRKPDKTFEQGIGRAIVAILASPRFLYGPYLMKRTNVAFMLLGQTLEISLSFSV